MTRFIYAGGGDGEVVDATGHPRALASYGIYNARVGGSLVTDVLDMAGTGLAGTGTTDAYGQAIFQGPSGYTSTLWLDFGGGGVRWGVGPKEIDQAHAGGQIIADQRTVDYSGRTASAKAAIPTNASVPLLAAVVAAIDPMVIARFPSQATRNAAFPSPADGDTIYRTDLHAMQTYSSAAARWVTAPGLIGEAVISGSTVNSVTFSSIPQEWNTLRMVVGARKCGTSSQTHKIGVEMLLQFNADTTAANYATYGTARINKWASATLTYGVLSTDGTGGSTTASAAIPVRNTALAGGYCGSLPGESTAANQTGLADILIPGYSANAGHQSFSSRGGWDDPVTSGFLAEYDLKGAWAALVPVTSITLALFTGAFFGVGSTVRLYGL